MGFHFGLVVLICFRSSCSRNGTSNEIQAEVSCSSSSPTRQIIFSGVIHVSMDLIDATQRQKSEGSSTHMPRCLHILNETFMGSSDDRQSGGQLYLDIPKSNFLQC